MEENGGGLNRERRDVHSFLSHCRRRKSTHHGHRGLRRSVSEKKLRRDKERERERERQRERERDRDRERERGTLPIYHPLTFHTNTHRGEIAFDPCRMSLRA